MKDKIEVYVRHSSNGTFLNLYIPSNMKSELVSTIHNGGNKGNDLAVTVELPVLSEWISDPEVRAKFVELNENIHLKIPITSLNVNFSEE